MSRHLSLAILLGVVVAIGVLFFKVIQPFLFSLLFAAVVAVLFRPVYAKLTEYLGGRVAAAALTLFILLLILLPLGAALVLAGSQLLDLGQDVVVWMTKPEESWIADEVQRLRKEEWVGWIVERSAQLPDDQQQVIRNVASKAADGVSKGIYDKTQGFLADTVSFVIGLVVMALALYYFLADGPALLSEIKELSPLDDDDEDVLFEQFGKVCRGVVLGTVVSAVVQGVLAGLGFMVVGIEWLWLASALTIFFSFIPFLGAAAVWIMVTIGLLLEHRYGSAAFIAIYGTIIISGSDNVIKAYIIGGEAKLHPLVVLITVLGALNLIGLWGIFVGPMIAAFFYALLNILRNRLNNSGERSVGQAEPQS